MVSFYLQDLPSLALVLGVPDTVKQKLVAWEKSLTSAIGKARRNAHNVEAEEKTIQTTLSVQKAGLSTLMTGSEYKMSSLKRKITNERLRTVSQMREIFQKYIIRRTNKSCIYDLVMPVNPLPDRFTHDFTLEMNGEERRVLDEIRARVVEEVYVLLCLSLGLDLHSLSPSTKEFDIDQIPTRYFFNEYRLAISHTGYKSKSKGHAEVIPEMWKSVEDWRQKRSTKWACIAQLAIALLCNDNGPFPFAMQKTGPDGELVDDYELIIPDAEVNLHARGKLVIYVEFTKLLDLLVTVCFLLFFSSDLVLISSKGLTLEGLSPLVLTGATSVKKRAEALRDFKDPEQNHRLLVLSSIGGAGLNLHEARFMIFAVSVPSVSRSFAEPAHRTTCGPASNRNRSSGASTEGRRLSSAMSTSRIWPGHRTWLCAIRSPSRRSSWSSLSVCPSFPFCISELTVSRLQ